MDRLGKDVVHEICTNQVVVTLQACVKELVENSLDAGAIRIEVKLRESGAELLEVVDDGSGISSADYAKVAQRHATSKIRDYDDLSKSLDTFGFRGEALSAICAMGEVTIVTRTANDATGVALTYDRFGKLTGETPTAREIGTTISIRDLFKRLPVRHREFLRNSKAQVSATLRLIQAYAVAQPQIRFHVVAEKARGHGAGRATLLSTSGSVRGWRDAAAAVLGDQVVADTQPLEIKSETGFCVSGLISTPLGGRRSRDTQLYYVNRRPIDPPKRVAKLVNDTYHQYNSRMWPMVILSFSGTQSLVDVNVTPDKRTVFMHNEESLMAELQKALTELYAGACSAPFGSSACPASGGNAALTSFGIKPTSKKEQDDDDGLVARTPESPSVGRVISGTRTLPSTVAAEATPGANGGSTAASADDDIEFETPPRMPATSAVARVGHPPSQGDMSVSKPAFAGALGGGSKRYNVGIDLVVEEYQAETQRTVLDTQASVAETQAVSVGGFADVTACDDSGQLLVEEYVPPSSVAAREDQFSVVELQMPAAFTSDGAVDSVVLEDVSMGTVEVGGDFSVVEFDSSAQPAASTLGAPETRAVAEGSVVSFMVAPPVELPPPEFVATTAVNVSISMAALAAAVDRRKRRQQASTQSEASAPSAPTVAFPSGFSLSSLRAGGLGSSQSGGSSSSRLSVEAVANFRVADKEPAEDGDESAAVSNSSAPATATQGFRFDKSYFSQMRVIGQFNLGFILAALRTQAPMNAANSNGSDATGLQLFIVDQHASDEKFRFEALNRDSKVDKQPLVSPHYLQLTPAQEQLANSHLEVFKLNGFGLAYDDSRPPGRRLRITALPTCRGLVFGEKDVHDLLHTLEEAETDRAQPSAQDAAAGLLDLAGHRAVWSNSTMVPRPKKVWQLLACRACRGAIMIGKALRMGEMERVLANLGSLHQPWNCPHGRPTMRHLVDAGAAWKTPTKSPPLSAQLIP